jgi:hypothetical protein
LSIKDVSFKAFCNMKKKTHKNESFFAVSSDFFYKFYKQHH